MTCPLCAERDPAFYHRDNARTYHRCRRCALVFVPPEAWLEPGAERARYEQHRNDPDDQRYRQFLARLSEPLLERVSHGTVGLDFGSGPGPTLAVMLEEAGLKVRLFDPFYAPDETVWTERYAFIAASEVLEHLRDPAGELDRLFGVLNPGGWLGVMTRWVGSHDDFVSWRYIRDPTHVAFYSRRTLRWIAERWAAPVDFAGDNVALFRKG